MHRRVSRHKNQSDRFIFIDDDCGLAGAQHFIEQLLYFEAGVGLPEG